MRPRLFRQTLLYLPAQVVGPFSQMAAAFIWTHWLTPDALGAYALIIAVQELINLVALNWWSGYPQRYLTTHEGADESLGIDRMEAAVQLMASGAQTMLVLAAFALAFDYTVTADL